MKDVVIRKKVDTILPFVKGDNIRYATAAPPALSPKIVTLLESPKKFDIFFFTHLSAKTMSFKAAFPGTSKDGSSNLRNPIYER